MSFQAYPDTVDAQTGRIVAEKINGASEYVRFHLPKSADWALWVCSSLESRVFNAANLHSISGRSV
ncbi:hypothetical protein [Deinococcus koreensis]|uniref:Uncharacterized protein n=1 Tax=Deinococcus koreensis TaxID=2054903 RepID=A0A2K3UWP9_9DEIO|nr:hypothetical protein [Deinococcus koreensis]PNY80959.1 hypothetical protein CVO96_05845 [Deinococcus koreensis]